MDLGSDTDLALVSAPAHSNGAGAGAAHSSRVVMVTPALAQTWLETCCYQRQRSIRPQVVTGYAAMIERGEWRLVNSLKFATLGDRPLLIDGYHRLTAVVAAARAVEFVVETYQVGSAEELNALYSAIDRGRPRVLTDVYRAMDLAADLGMQERWVRSIGEAHPYIASQFAAGPGRVIVSAAERVAFVRAWVNEARRLWACWSAGSKATRRLLDVAPVNAVALYTLRYQPDMAELFWSIVAENDGLRRGSPEHTLLDWLADHRVASITGALYCRYVANAWNAYYSNREITSLAIKDRRLDLPTVILGTPLSRAHRSEAIQAARGEARGRS
jgi:hypothetical protein